MKKVIHLSLFIIVLSLPMLSQAKPLDIYVSIPPQKWLLEQLGGELVTTHVLVGKGQDPHTFEPTPRQVVSLSAAQVFFTMNMPFENVLLHKLVHNNTNLKTLDVTKGIQRIPFTRDEEHGHHDHEEAHHDHHGHDHKAGLDPHTWLSAKNLQKMAEIMTETLIKLDAANTEVYAKNLATIKKQLTDIDEKIHHQLEPYHDARFYVFHPSFGYFAHDYHLIQEAVEIEGKSPSPKQLSKLIQMAKADKVKVIFTQPQFDQRSGQAIAAAINGSVVPLNPLAENVAENLQLMADKIAASLSK